MEETTKKLYYIIHDKINDNIIGISSSRKTAEKLIKEYLPDCLYTNLVNKEKIKNTETLTYTKGVWLGWALIYDTRIITITSYKINSLAQKYDEVFINNN